MCVRVRVCEGTEQGTISLLSLLQMYKLISRLISRLQRYPRSIGAYPSGSLLINGEQAEEEGLVVVALGGPSVFQLLWDCGHNGSYSNTGYHMMVVFSQ